MILFRTAITAMLLTSTAAFAQTATPAAPAGAPTPAVTAAPAATAQPSDTGLTKEGKPRMRVVRQQCRDEVKGENLTGDARKQAVAVCIVKQRPDMEARVKCQMDPSLKGRTKDARQAAVQACVAKAKS